MERQISSESGRSVMFQQVTGLSGVSAGHSGPREARKVGVRRAFTRFESTLRARNLSARTIRNYLDTAEAFAVFCDEQFGPLELDQVTDEHVNTYIALQLSEWTPSTAATRFRCLQQLFRFAECSGYVEVSPMAGLRPPKVRDAPVPVLRDHELVRLLRACEGTEFREVRDFAMLRLLIDAGTRREELATMALEALDLDHQFITINGKGGQVRAVSFGSESTAALIRYLKVRAEHPYSDDRHLWLGLRGPMTGDGVRYMVDQRSAQAGVEGVFPHRFRHTFAHRWLVAGGNETDLQTLAGWRSSQMLSRYGASARAERAAIAHRRIGLGDAIK